MTYTKYCNLTDEELLREAKHQRQTDPLVSELCIRLADKLDKQEMARAFQFADEED